MPKKHQKDRIDGRSSGKEDGTEGYKEARPSRRGELGHENNSMEVYWAIHGMSGVKTVKEAKERLKEVLMRDDAHEWDVTVTDGKCFLSHPSTTLPHMEQLILERDDLRVNLSRFQDMCEELDEKRKEAEKEIAELKDKLQVQMRSTPISRTPNAPNQYNLLHNRPSGSAAGGGMFVSPPSMASMGHQTTVSSVPLRSQQQEIPNMSNGINAEMTMTHPLLNKAMKSGAESSDMFRITPNRSTAGGMNLKSSPLTTPRKLFSMRGMMGAVRVFPYFTPRTLSDGQATDPRGFHINNTMPIAPTSTHGSTIHYPESVHGGSSSGARLETSNAPKVVSPRSPNYPIMSRPRMGESSSSSNQQVEGAYTCPTQAVSSSQAVNTGRGQGSFFRTPRLSVPSLPLSRNTMNLLPQPPPLQRRSLGFGGKQLPCPTTKGKLRDAPAWSTYAPPPAFNSKSGIFPVATTSRY